MLTASQKAHLREVRRDDLDAPELSGTVNDPQEHDDGIGGEPHILAAPGFPDLPRVPIAANIGYALQPSVHGDVPRVSRRASAIGHGSVGEAVSVGADARE